VLHDEQSVDIGPPQAEQAMSQTEQTPTVALAYVPTGHVLAHEKSIVRYIPSLHDRQDDVALLAHWTQGKLQETHTSPSMYIPAGQEDTHVDAENRYPGTHDVHSEAAEVHAAQVGLQSWHAPALLTN